MLLGAYARMLPRLQAEEQLAAIAAIQIGGANTKKSQRAARKVTRRLEKVARGGRKSPPVKAGSLRAAGITAVEVERVAL